MSVTFAPGFIAGGGAAGIKASGALDLALVATEDHQPAVAAAVFTANTVAAAPVQISRRHVADGQAVAVLLNSGNANAATGAAGRATAEAGCVAVSAALGCQSTDVLVCSTGLIGIPLAAEPIVAAVPALVAGLASDGGGAAAQAIMTTDTRPKEAAVTLDIHGCRIRVGGMAKGAAMLAPAMATMLAVITTDVAIEADALQQALTAAVDRSFNRLLVDGCTSTNDTVIVLANGRAGNPPITVGSDEAAEVASALERVCSELALAMARDAEGGTRVVSIAVRGAASDADALRAARTVAASQLVQCSINGCDPYWGRVLAELGASGVELDPEHVDIAYGGVVVCRNGIAALHDVAAANAVVHQPEYTISCELHRGYGEATVITTDLSHAYIDENRGTS